MKAAKKFSGKRRFPEKLWDAVGSSSGLLQWSDDGLSFDVNCDRFEADVMSTFPDLVQVPTFANFRRQLRVYGFQWKTISGRLFSFSHPNFTQMHFSKVSLVHSQRLSDSSSPTSRGNEARKRKRDDSDFTHIARKCKSENYDLQSVDQVVEISPLNANQRSWERYKERPDSAHEFHSDLSPVPSNHSPVPPHQTTMQHQNSLPVHAITHSVPGMHFPHLSHPHPFPSPAPALENLSGKWNGNARPYVRAGMEGESSFGLVPSYENPYYPMWEPHHLPHSGYMLPGFPPPECNPVSVSANKNGPNDSPESAPSMATGNFRMNRMDGHINSLLLSGGVLVPNWDPHFLRYNPLTGEHFNPAASDLSLPNSVQHLKPSEYLPHRQLDIDSNDQPSSLQPMSNVQLPSPSPEAVVNKQITAAPLDSNITAGSQARAKQMSPLSPLCNQGHHESNSLNAFIPRD